LALGSAQWQSVRRLHSRSSAASACVPTFLYPFVLADRFDTSYEALFFKGSFAEVAGNSCEPTAAGTRGQSAKRCDVSTSSSQRMFPTIDVIHRLSAQSIRITLRDAATLHPRLKSEHAITAPFCLPRLQQLTYETFDICTLSSNGTFIIHSRCFSCRRSSLAPSPSSLQGEVA
jgi:hypothetical protein